MASLHSEGDVDSCTAVFPQDCYGHHLGHGGLCDVSAPYAIIDKEEEKCFRVHRFFYNDISKCCHSFYPISSNHTMQ